MVFLFFNDVLTDIGRNTVNVIRSVKVYVSLPQSGCLIDTAFIQS